uniref:Uncharacterized protein n=1 Tax=Astyanax mexicanus TaxID=7994 RepID=A0A3B1ILD8_ASTMX
TMLLLNTSQITNSFCYFIAHTEESLSYLEAFEVQDDDIFAVTYPKSGENWDRSNKKGWES